MTPGIVNVDFADIKTIMENMGLAVIGVGRATGKDRAINAVNFACNSPLLEIPIDGARGVLFSISSNRDLKMEEVNEIAKTISSSVDQNARIIFGTYHNSDLRKGEIKTVVIATGFAEYLTNPVLPQGDLLIKTDQTIFPEPVKDDKIERKVQTLDLVKEKNKKKPEKKLKDISGGEDFFDVPAFLRKKKNKKV